MRTIITGHGFGKTTELIKLASHSRYGLIVCHTRQAVETTWVMMQKMFDNGTIDRLPPMPITYQEFLDRQYYGKHVDRIFIDDADRFLQNLTNVPIGAITINRD